MKKLNDILSTITNNPSFNKLKTFGVVEKIVSALPSNLKKGVKFAYIKDNMLFFALTHPIFKIEFKHKKNDILKIVKICKADNILDVSWFVSNEIIKKEIPEEVTASYKERSFGIFENFVTDEKLHKTLENIRKLIKKNQTK